MPSCTKVMPSANWTASAPATRTISWLNHTACTLPVYASQRGLPHHHATLGSGCRHTWPGGTGYPLGSNEKFQRRSPHPNLPGLAWRTQVAFKTVLIMLSKAWGAAPPHPLAGQQGCQPGAPMPKAAATPAGGPTAQPPLAPSAWPRAQTRTAKSCWVRGSHFPTLFDYFNLERKSVLDRIYRIENSS
jgi:hypothetical protein